MENTRDGLGVVDSLARGVLALIPAITWRQAGGAALMIAGLLVLLLVALVIVRKVGGRKPGVMGQRVVGDHAEPRVAPSARVGTRAIRRTSGLEDIAFLKNAVMGILDNRQDLERCIQALKWAGFGDMDVRTIAGRPGETAVPLDVEQAEEPRHSLRVASLVGDEWDVLDGYEEEWRAGHGAVAVRIRRPEQVERATSILAEHHAHHIKRFGKWSITDIALGTAALAERETLRREAEEQTETPAREVPLETLVGSLPEADIFRGVPERWLWDVAAMGAIREVPAGAVLAAQGELNTRLFVILSGEVALSAVSSRGGVTVRVAGPGETFPLAALLGSGRLITTATATSPLRLIELPSGSFRRLCDDRPEIGIEVYRAIANILGDRYRHALHRLTGAGDKAPSREDAFANV